MIAFEQFLSGGDLRSISGSNWATLHVKNQNSFNQLFRFLFHNNRLVVMRCADAIEKITRTHPQYLTPHSKQVIQLCGQAKNKELKWHLALLIARLYLKGDEFTIGWDILTNWACDKTNSRIVRVNSLQGLAEMTRQEKSLLKSFNLVLHKLENENIPSINARIKKIRKQMD